MESNFTIFNQSRDSYHFEEELESLPNSHPCITKSVPSSIIKKHVQNIKKSKDNFINNHLTSNK
jgi:hypothetical protein